MVPRTMSGMWTYVEVVISPATTAMPVVTSVSQATRAAGSLAMIASRTASEIWSAILSKGAIVATLTATLALRPVGAVIFGMLADRFGRRRPLMANVVFFSVIEFACGFAPSYPVFLALRALYGIGMGGEW